MGVEGPILPLLAGPQRLPSSAWVSRAGVLERRPTRAQGPPLVHHPRFGPRATAEKPRVLIGPSISPGSARKVICTTKAAPRGAFCIVNTKPCPRPSGAPGEKLPEESRPYSASLPHNSGAHSFEMLMF